jgi:hypothetical protein
MYDYQTGYPLSGCVARTKECYDSIENVEAVTLALFPGYVIIGITNEQGE